jgi:hypothetical protein
LQQTIGTAGQHPATIFPVRSFAMMHAAMFDAVNSIDGTYTPYLIDVPNFRQASREAAAAKAARDVLVALYPSRQDVFDAELNVSLTGIPGNRVRQGMRVGETVAAALLAARTNDGWNAPVTPYVLPLTPGNWQPAPALAGFTHFPMVVPFAITSATQFAPAAPPALSSEQYASSFNEVKELGSVTSATRTAEQTQIARLWANVNTPTTVWFVWNNVARTVALARNTSTAETARLFALLNISMHDALLTTMASKFQHGLWRPLRQSAAPTRMVTRTPRRMATGHRYWAIRRTRATPETTPPSALRRLRFSRCFSGAMIFRSPTLGKAQAAQRAHTRVLRRWLTKKNAAVSGWNSFHLRPNCRSIRRS